MKVLEAVFGKFAPLTLLFVFFVGFALKNTIMRDWAALVTFGVAFAGFVLSAIHILLLSGGSTKKSAQWAIVLIGVLLVVVSAFADQHFSSAASIIGQSILVLVTAWSSAKGCLGCGLLVAGLVFAIVSGIAVGAGQALYTAEGLPLGLMGGEVQSPPEGLFGSAQAETNQGESVPVTLVPTPTISPTLLPTIVASQQCGSEVVLRGKVTARSDYLAPYEEFVLPAGSFVNLDGSYADVEGTGWVQIESASSEGEALPVSGYWIPNSVCASP